MPIPTQHDKVHAEMFRRLNDVESKVDTSNGYNKALAEFNATLVEQNKELIGLLKKTLSGQLLLIVALAGALIYGAIGKDGLFAVRQTIPIPGGNDDDKAALSQPLAPPPDNRVHPTN